LNNTANDNSLWNSFLSGDKNAFGQLFSRHYAFLFSYGIKMCSDKQITEDCIQELFIEIWKNKNSTPHISIRLYLAKALRYKIFRYLKNNISTKPELTDIADSYFEISHETLMIERQNNEGNIARMIACFSKLPKRQREIIYLRFIKNLDYDEISEIMDINYQAARNLVYQSVRQLKTVFASALPNFK
jgi:RNA polymerase sigma factor (sigma-70 family)